MHFDLKQTVILSNLSYFKGNALFIPLYNQNKATQRNKNEKLFHCLFELMTLSHQQPLFFYMQKKEQITK